MFCSHFPLAVPCLIWAVCPPGTWRAGSAALTSSIAAGFDLCWHVMGKRREPRTEVAIPVRIFGTDADGRVFSENVVTVDVSRSGAKITGIQARIKPGEIIGITHGTQKSRFKVSWAGQPGTPGAGQIGVLNTTPEKSIWDVPLPAPAVDSFRHQSSSDRREYPRMQCVNSVQLQPDGQSAPIWGKASDLSIGGCFVGMPVPLQNGTKLKISMWLDQAKLTLKGKVVNSRPGFGIGVQFVEIKEPEAVQLRQFLQGITRVRI
jgi:PilZ domain